MSTSLPPDVLVEILSRLPTKSLLRFMCVSKTWLALIGNHDFFSENLLNHSILAPQNPGHPLPLILVKATDKSNAKNFVFHSLSYETLDCVSQIPMNLPPANLPPGPVHPFIRQCYNVKIVASCNGLLCLYEFRTGDVYLWNPTTPSIGFNAIPRLSPHGPHPFSVGFGFDPNSGDFKVVSLRDVESDTGTVALVAGVYSLSRRCWRLLDLRVPNGICVTSETLGLGRVFLWLDQQDGDQIISFDFTDEVFRTTPLPYSRDELGFCDQLMELNGCVAMAVYPDHALTDINIWVLLEFGVKESWTRFVCIEPPMDLERPLGFWKNGKLFMENSEGQLVLYDPFTQTKKNLAIEGLKDSLEVVLYTQSSVAINGEVEFVGEANL